MQTQEFIPLARANLQELNNKVEQFSAKWNSFPSVVAMNGKCPSSVGDIEFISCLDYVIYEGLETLIAKNAGEFIELSGAVFGYVVAKKLRFRWCELQVGESRTLGLINDYNGIKLPIRELILNKLSTLPQFESFEHLFFDILLSETVWELGTHPLMECNLLTLPGEKTFEEIYGFNIPADISNDIDLLGSIDHDFLMRTLGLQAYILAHSQKWNELRDAVAHVTRQFNEQFGEGWRNYALQMQGERLTT